MQVVINADTGKVLWLTGYKYHLNGEDFWPTAEMAKKDARANVPEAKLSPLLTWETKNEDKANKLSKAFAAYGPDGLQVVRDGDSIANVRLDPEFEPPAPPPTMLEQLLARLDAIDAALARIEAKNGA